MQPTLARIRNLGRIDHNTPLKHESFEWFRMSSHAAGYWNNGIKHMTSAFIAVSRTRLWLVSGWGCRGRRLSRERGPVVHQNLPRTSKRASCVAIRALKFDMALDNAGVAGDFES